MKFNKNMDVGNWWIRSLHCLLIVAITSLLVWWIPRQWRSSSSTDIYPSRPIQIVVPYAAGGGSDTFVRIMQQGMQEADEFDQPLVIINQPGGIGTIGSREVKNAEPDGYKILCHHNAIITAKLAETVDYGPEAFESIALTGEMSMVVLVRADSPIVTLRGLIEQAAREPNTIRFAANKGAPAYYAALQLENAVEGAALTIVSSGGGADRYSKIIGGHLDAGIFSLSEYLDFLGPEGTPPDRDVRAIAVLSAERHDSIPEVQSSVEMEIPVVLRNANYWWAPKGTPRVVLDRLADALNHAMQQPTVIEELKRLRLDPTFAIGDELDQRLTNTLDGFAGVAENQAIKIPRFDYYVGGTVLVLLSIVIIERFRSSSTTGSADSQGKSMTGLAKQWPLAGAVFLTVSLHVIAIQTGLLPLATTISSMVLILGLMLAHHVSVRKLWLVEMAILTGLGTEYVLAEVLKMALPG